MRCLWIVLAAGLAACDGSGSTTAQSATPAEPKPVVSLDKGQYARFASNIGDQLQQDKVQQAKLDSALAKLNEDPFVSILMQIFGLPTTPQVIDWSRACLVNVLTVEKSSIKNTYYKAKESCDCLTVQPESVVSCIGEELKPEESFTFVNGKIDTAKLGIQHFAAQEVCPAVDNVEGIPVLPPDCLGEDAKDWEYTPNTSTSNGIHQFVGEAVAKANQHDLDGIEVYEAGKHITREGLEALSLTYKNVKNDYENCELDAQVVIAFDESGNLIPARRPSVIELEKKEYTNLFVNPPQDGAYTVDYQLVSPEVKKCKLPASTSDNANSTGIDNALSPYAGLDVEREFKPLENGVLTLDYEKKFYRIMDVKCPALEGVEGIPFIPPDCLGE